MLTVHSPYVSHGAAFLLCGLRSHSACCLAAVRFRALFLEVQGNRAIVPPRLALCNVSRTALLHRSSFVPWLPGFCWRRPGGVISHPFDFSRTPRAKVFHVILNPYASSRDALCGTTAHARCVVRVLFCGNDILPHV